MPGWWSSPGGRTRRPREKLALPSDVVLIPRDERERIAGGVLARVPYVVLLGGLVWLTVYLLTAPEFRIGGAEVVGARLVSAEEVVAASGLLGQNVFLVNVRQTEEAILRVRPLEASRLEFVWPGTARVEVVERRPFAIWRTGDRAYLVGEAGVVLAPATGESLPITIVDVDGRPVAVGDQVDPEALADAAYLLTALKPTPLGVKFFEYSQAQGLVAPGDQGLRVAFGRGGDLPAKVATLRALLDELAARKLGVQFIDLRVEGHPSFR